MLHPFKAVRPTRDKAYLVATRSYISYSDEHLKDKLDHNPYTFLHVINPKALPELTQEERHMAVRKRFEEFVAQGIFLEEASECYYVYKQETPTHTFVGIFGLLDAWASTDGRVLPHESTIEQREQLFISYLEHVGFQAEPVLVFGESDSTYERIIEEVTAQRAEYEFASTDRHVHYLWKVPSSHNAALEAFFKRESKVYVADGHHRLASSVRMAELHKNNLDAQGILCMFMADHQLAPETFERWVKSEISLDWSRIEMHFEVQPLHAVSCHFQNQLLQVFEKGQWYGLVPKWKTDVEELSTQILFDRILRPLLEIKDERTDQRLSYVKQDEQDKSSEMLSQGYTIGFRALPPSVDLICRMAENKINMPPKSTYIEPKLRSGLIIHTFL